jgi:glycopeptide antibiotics resistance protein
MTVTLLVFTTLVMAGLIYVLSGRAYASESYSTREIMTRVVRTSRGELSSNALMAVMMPLLGNLLLFVPWGFLMFLALDLPGRPRSLSYLLTILAALILAAAMVAWQSFLPTRVTAWPDAIANAGGAFVGASLGHARKSVRIQFEF